MKLTAAPTIRYSDPILKDEGVTRRDPSPVIGVDGTYYVYYSRTTETAHGYTASLWYATSGDGHAWTEQGEALGKGGPGAWDEHGCFTTTTLVWGGRYYLIYTGVPSPFTNDNGGPNCTPTAIGLAVADDPAGPFTRVGREPILRPSADRPERFDSLRVDDACAVVREGRIYLYYKGRQAGNTPANTRMGLAIATEPTGPYVKVGDNDIVNGGHEVCCWPQGTGVMAMFCNVGPAGNTLQYAADGIHFERLCEIEPPRAPGPYRADGYVDGAGPGISWGISHMGGGGPWPYLVRFDIDYAVS